MAVNGKVGPELRRDHTLSILTVQITVLMSISWTAELASQKMRVTIPQLLLPWSYFAAALKGLQYTVSISRRMRTASSVSSTSTSDQRNGVPVLTELITFTLCARPMGKAPI